MSSLRKWLFAAATMVLATLLVSCAKKTNQVSLSHDPYIAFNRKMFSLNMKVDRVLLRPVARVYAKVMPSPVRSGVGNFFSNVNMLTIIPNDLLQFKLRYALVDCWRFVFNTTLGVGGLFDVASHLGVPKHYEDFGLTLAYWGGGQPSSYVVLPFLGPGTMRSSYGFAFDYIMSPWPYYRPWWLNYTLSGVQVVQTRSGFLETDPMVAQAFDPYVFVRNAYMQRRLQLVRQNEHRYQTKAQRLLALQAQPASGPAANQSGDPEAPLAMPMADLGD